PADDFAYDGAAGRTRREPLHVSMPDGAIRSIPAHRVVNVGTDPDLREPALAGILHRFESGEELALPFVFHDPAARKLALVLPPSLRHRELAERARLLEALEADAEHPIPGYVRHFAVVIGLEELAEYLALPAPHGSALEAARREAALQQREQALAAREDELLQRARDLEGTEQELAARAEQLGGREQEVEARAEQHEAREQELAGWAEQLEAWQRELEQRTETLEGREQALAAQSQDRPSGELVGADDVAEVIDDAEDLEEVTPSDADDPSIEVAEADMAELDAAVGEAEPVEPDEVRELDAAGEAEPVEPDEVQELDAADGAPVDPEDLAELVEEAGPEADAPDVGALRLGLQNADERAAAAVTLCRRGGPEDLEAVRHALGRMTPDEMAPVFAALAARGEEAGDVLVRSLRAAEPYVRHGAALALGELGLSRAVQPLVQLVRSEPEDLWQEAARVLGRFGAPALRTLRSHLDRAEGREERLAYALASFAESGCEDQVRALRENSDGAGAKIAREAMALRDVVRSHTEAALGEAPPDPGDPIRPFSRRFYENLNETV
ncbi:MAG: HEAT repeat domain-containing protein, partial [Myxococcota bacterium]